jgi:hypothetical protein
MQGHSYNAAERVLHYLALASKPVAELSFDLNAVLSSRERRPAADDRHVFVSGLARAGTTIIMRRLHETGAFRSLTYRDMPFVLCPSLWQRISSTARKDAHATERAHGDRLTVDFDTPEALDEVFWRVFAGALYIKNDHLCIHAADSDLIEKFRNYIRYILDAQDPADRRSRYLSKNNNNILRLDAVRAAFPRATIVIPFRDPIQHANSLLEQHIRFSRLQRDDRFIRSYMGWLAHHEFGLAHKPFQLDRRSRPEASPHEVASINYWLERWLEAYAWLLANRPDTSVLVCYEDLCSDPRVWDRMLGRLELRIDGATSMTALARAGDKDVPGVDADLAATSHTLYDQLRHRSELSL